MSAYRHFQSGQDSGGSERCSLEQTLTVKLDGIIELMASILPALHQAAPRLTRQLFQCTHQRCLPSISRAFQKSSPGSRHRRNAVSAAVSGHLAAQRAVSQFKDSPTLSALGKSITEKSVKGFPETSHKVVAYWLLGSAASVFGIVVFGGLTRLTESG